MTLLESLGPDPIALRGALNDSLEQSRLWAIEGNDRLRAEYMATAAEIAEVLGAIEMTPAAGEEDPVMPFEVVRPEIRQLRRGA